MFSYLGNQFKPSSKIFSLMLLLWIIYVIYLLILLCFRAGMFIDALWSPAGTGLASWLSFVMSNCKVDTFPLIFDPYLLFKSSS